MPTPIYLRSLGQVLGMLSSGVAQVTQAALTSLHVSRRSAG